MSALVGRRVLITRSKEDNAAWARRLRALGAEVVELACIECETLDARARLAAPDAEWIVFSSRRGVDAFVELGAAAGADARIACVSAATATRATEHFGRCDLVSAGGTARALGEELAAAHPPARALLALAEDARDELERALTVAGWKVERVAVYRTRPAARLEPKEALAVDVALLASPSAVTGLQNLVTLASAAHVVTIGPTTSAAARAAGLAVAAEAKTRDLDGMLAAVEAIPAEPQPNEERSTP